MEIFKSQYVLLVVLELTMYIWLRSKAETTVPNFLKKMNSRYDHVLFFFLNNINKT